MTKAGFAKLKRFTEEIGNWQLKVKVAWNSVITT